MHLNAFYRHGCCAENHEHLSMRLHWAYLVQLSDLGIHNRPASFLGNDLSHEGLQVCVHMYVMYVSVITYDCSQVYV
jgi:hypothetical protein